MRIIQIINNSMNCLILMSFIGLFFFLLIKFRFKIGNPLFFLLNLILFLMNFYWWKIFSFNRNSCLNRNWCGTLSFNFSFIILYRRGRSSNLSNIRTCTGILEIIWNFSLLIISIYSIRSYLFLNRNLIDHLLLNRGLFIIFISYKRKFLFKHSNLIAWLIILRDIWKLNLIFGFLNIILAFNRFSITYKKRRIIF